MLEDVAAGGGEGAAVDPEAAEVAGAAEAEKAEEMDGATAVLAVERCLRQILALYQQVWSNTPDSEHPDADATS